MHGETHPKGSALLDDRRQLRETYVHSEVPGLPGEKTEGASCISAWLLG